MKTAVKKTAVLMPLAMAALLIAADAPPAPTVTFPMLPGQWEFTSRILNVDMPGQDPEKTAPIRQMMTSMPPKIYKQCLSSDELAALLNSGMDGRTCDSSAVRLTAGKLSGTIVCTGDGKRITVAATGSVAPQTMALQFDVDARSAAPESQDAAGAMIVKMDLAARRIGDCPPPSPPPPEQSETDKP